MRIRSASAPLCSGGQRAETEIAERLRTEKELPQINRVWRAAVSKSRAKQVRTRLVQRRQTNALDDSTSLDPI